MFAEKKTKCKSVGRRVPRNKGHLSVGGGKSVSITSEEMLSLLMYECSVVVMVSSSCGGLVFGAGSQSLKV